MPGPISAEALLAMFGIIYLFDYLDGLLATTIWSNFILKALS